MKRKLLSTALLTVVLAVPAVAQQQSLIDRVIAELRAQGFDQVEVSRTWLGRTRVEARGPGVQREIVVNPRTGEILRDYTEHQDAASEDDSGILGGLFGAAPGTDGSGDDKHGGDGKGGNDDGHGDGGGDGHGDGGDGHDGGGDGHDGGGDD